MNEKINLRTTRVLTIPRSFMKNIEDLYYLVESNWNDCESWDNFFELLRDIIDEKSYCSYLGTEINYIDDEKVGE